MNDIFDSLRKMKKQLGKCIYKTQIIILSNKCICGNNVFKVEDNKLICLECNIDNTQIITDGLNEINEL